MIQSLTKLASFPHKGSHKFLIASVLLLFVLYRKFKRNSAAKLLIAKAFKKRKQRDALLNKPIPQIKVSPELQQIVLSASITQLSEMMNNDEITSEEVLLIFFQRVRTIGLSYELIADVNFDDALEAARKCDEKRKSMTKEERKSLGLLFGIPISVKDNFKVKGLDSTFGLASRCFEPQTEDAPIVEVLKNQGAIPFIKSSGPQMMMTIETINNVWGRAKNPWNPERTVGGSSGGEGGLVASRCSPVGIGTDIGGSVRIPALYCGVYGIKPTVERMSAKGIVYPNKAGKNGNTLIKTVAGPIGKCVEDLRIILKTLISDELQSLDPRVTKQQWDSSWEEKPLRKLRIGFIDNDEFFEVCPTNKRAVFEACEALRAKGHEIVSLKGIMPSFEKVQLIYSGIFTAEGKLRTFFQALQGEPIIKEYNQWVTLAFMPAFLRTLLSKVLKLLNQKRASTMLVHSGEKKVFELFEYVKELELLRDEVLHIWKNYNLDALITPGMALPAVRHGEAHSLYLNACYTMLWNLINFPTGVLPITKVKSEETSYSDPNRKYKGDQYDKLANCCLKRAEGLPVGVQISTLPFEEEKCLAIMKQVEDVIGFHELPI